MPRVSRELIEYYVNAHKNIWKYVREKIYIGSSSDIITLKTEACCLNGYNFRFCCALCELLNVIECGCDTCSLITGISHIGCGCLEGLYDNICEALTDNKPLRLELANEILHCVDNWEENAKKGGLI